MIKLKLRDLVESVPGLNHLNKKELSFMLSYKLLSIQAKIEPILQVFNTARLNVIKKHGTINKKNNERNEYKIKSEALAKKFNEEINSLLDEGVELLGNKIPFELFKDIEISPDHLKGIKCLLDIKD